MANVKVFYAEQSTTVGEPGITLNFSSGAYDIIVSALPSMVHYQASTNESYSFTGIILDLRRKPSSLVGSFYGPTTLFVILSWLSFQIPINQANPFLIE